MPDGPVPADSSPTVLRQTIGDAHVLFCLNISHPDNWPRQGDDDD